MASNNLILLLLVISSGIFFYKYFPIFIKKFNSKILIDDQYTKPQAFHDSPVSTAGGIGIYFLLLIVFFNFYFTKNIYHQEYISFCTLFFILGFSDDLKIYIKPKIRLGLMILFLIFLIILNDFYIDKTGIEFLNNWLKDYKIFSLFFVCLCFLFVINGANLVDGYNGLLGFHSLIIFLNLFFVNYFNQNQDLAYLLFYTIIVLFIFLIFNFPSAKIFLGDGGSYLLGTFIALSAIKTSLENPQISPFYFCMLLFYLFFEVFFSFLRKLIKEKISPIHPDKKHLHMLLYKTLNKKNDKFKSNYSTTLIVNIIYLILLLPAIFMMENGLFCKYYSILFFIVYITSYKILYEKNK